MLRQKCSHRKDIETHKKQRNNNKKKNTTKVCNLTEQVKGKFLAENADIS